MHSGLCTAWSTTACIQNTAQMQSDQAGHELLRCSEKEVVSAGPGPRARGLSAMQHATSLSLQAPALAAAYTAEVRHVGCFRQQDLRSQEHARTPS